MSNRGEIDALLKDLLKWRWIHGALFGLQLGWILGALFWNLP